MLLYFRREIQDLAIADYYVLLISHLTCNPSIPASATDDYCCCVYLKVDRRTQELSDVSATKEALGVDPKSSLSC